MRVLQLDSFRAARIGLLLAALNMAILVIWFFTAKVTLYEVSTEIALGDSDRIIASFPKESLARVRVGQPAWLRVDLGAEQPSLKLPALVYEIQRDQNKVVFVVLANESPVNYLAEKPSGQVEVEVEYITPAELVLRTSGKLLNRNQIPLSPQTLETRD
jgi:hypothetical protein